MATVTKKPKLGEYSYFGELGYLCIYLLPLYEKHTFPRQTVIHTYSDYVDILSLYSKPNVTFIKYPFVKSARCCAEPAQITNNRVNLANHLKRNVPLTAINLIDKLKSPLINRSISTNYAGKILVFPRLRSVGDYGSYEKSLYNEIIKMFDKKNIVLCGHVLESHNLVEYKLKNIGIGEAITACKTADLCIIPDSGYASLLIASNVKKLIIIFNENFAKQQRDTYFHIDIYKKTSDWFKTDLYIVDNKQLLTFLKNKSYGNTTKRIYVDGYKFPAPPSENVVKNALANIKSPHLK